MLFGRCILVVYTVIFQHIKSTMLGIFDEYESIDIYYGVSGEYT